MVVPNAMTSPSPVAVQTKSALKADEETQASSSSINGSTSESSSVRTGGVQSGNGNENENGSGNGAQGSGKPGGGISRPQILSQIYPTYPEAAREAGITGTVLLRVQILENGCAGDISVKQSSGNDSLDESAVTAVYKWRFTPAKENNTDRAVACYTTVPVVFRLN